MVTQKSMMDDVALPAGEGLRRGVGGLFDWLFGN
jgi:hypothetical protein